MKYIFNKDNVQMKRNEKNGVAMIMIKDTHHQIVLNEVANNIFDMLDKYTTTEEIIDEVLRLYVGVEREEVEQDVLEIMSNFELFNVVKLDKDVCETVNTSKITMFGDENYKAVNRFIDEEIKKVTGIHLFMNADDKRYYSTMSLRARVMNNEEYGIIYQEEGKIKAAITFSIKSPVVTNVVVISSVLINDEIEYKADVFESMIEYILEQSKNIKRFKKIRIVLTENENSKGFIEFIEKMNFKNECTLIDEVETGNVSYYTKFV